MKKRFAFTLIIGVLLVPLLFRIALPAMYTRLFQMHPFFGLVLVIGLDVVWMWLLLFIIMLSSRLIRWVRHQKSITKDLTTYKESVKKVA